VSDEDEGSEGTTEGYHYDSDDDEGSPPSPTPVVKHTGEGGEG